MLYLCLVGAFSLSDWDFRKATSTGNQNRLFRYMIKLLDEATNAVLRLQSEGKSVTQWKVNRKNLPCRG